MLFWLAILSFISISFEFLQTSCCDVTDFQSSFDCVQEQSLNSLQIPSPFLFITFLSKDKIPYLVDIQRYNLQYFHSNQHNFRLFSETSGHDFLQQIDDGIRL